MKKVRLAACAVALTVGGLTPLGLSPAAADPASAAAAKAYGLNLDVAGSPVTEEAGLAESTLPPGGDVLSDLVNVPAASILETGAARGNATTSATSSIASLLDERVQQVPGPYNARAVGQVDDLGVVIDLDGPNANLLELALLSADSVRGEAVGVCRSGQALYSGQSEVVNLEINNQPVGLDDPVTGLLDTVNMALAPLAQVAKIDRNVVTPTANGITVDALIVTLVSLTGEPLSELIVGHAEVGGLQCPPVPQCSDTQDNDGDGLVDAQDPGCITDGVYDPNDNDERNECVDGIDNADPEDRLVDFGADPGCDSAQDDDETNLPRTAALPRTGGESSTTVPMAGGLALLALGALALRRRSQASA